MKPKRRVLPVVRLVLMLVFALTAMPAVTPAVVQAAPATCGSGDPTAVAGTCHVTIDVHDFASGGTLANYNFIVNLDNTKLPSDPLALNSESNSPIVRTGDQTRKTFTLPDGRYMVSARSLDHKLWGAYFTLPKDADNSGNLTVRIDLTGQNETHPLPLGKIRVFVFNDNAWTNGAPDTEEGGLGGFEVGLDEETGKTVSVDYNDNPLCGGICKTSAAASDLGFVEIPNLGPASYFIDVQPPETDCNPQVPGSRWTQTTTIDGGLQLLAPTEEGADGTGAPGEQLWEPPNIRTAYWFGFVCTPHPFTTSGTGEIVGQARNWVEWAPYTVGTFNDPVQNPFVALSSATSDQTVYVGRGDENGNFDIQGVPAGDYNLSIWDEQLSYIMRFKPVHVNTGQTVDVNETGDDGSVGVGVSRWFGWLNGTVYKDVNNNGQYDPGIDAPIPNTDMDQRWRDGSIKEATFTDANGNYEYPTAEGGALGRWIINEQGFARFSAFPGPSVHDEHTGAVIPSCDAVPTPNPCVPTDQGGGLLTNQLLSEGHRAVVDWGKRDYPAGTPGQIVGITYYATTRNEFDAKMQAHEDYEPAIPNVTVYLETPGPDGKANTADDVIVNKYVTDKWQQPGASQDPQAGGNTFTQSCNPIRDAAGNDVSGQFNPDLGPNCLEVPLNGIQTKDGAFDGGYAFDSYCPGGYDMAADNGTCQGGGQPVPLVAGNYILHAIMPKDPTDTRDCNAAVVPGDLTVTAAKGSIPGGGQGCIYRPAKEEDVNVDLGNQFAPAIPPPPCVGDAHVIDQTTLTPRSNYWTGDQSTSASAPLCDKKLVVLNNLQNANADFHLMTNFRTDPNGAAVTNSPVANAAALTGDVAEPARFVGQVFNDIYFERNQMSNWYGEPRPIGGIPIGIYARVDVANANCPGGTTTCITGREIGRDGSLAPAVTYDPNKWRLLTTTMTSPDGSFEALVPSTETFNCPIPQGPCPGMYMVSVDDPGFVDKATGAGTTLVSHANANYDPNLLAATTPASAWPGQTNPTLDLPLDPISGTACEDPAGGTTPDPSDPARPDLLQVSRPYVLSTDSGTNRRITIQSDFIGSGAGTVRLTDWRGNAVTNLTTGNGGIVSWTVGSASTPDTIVIQVPALSASFTPGPKQLTIITAAANGAVSSVNGITLHVLGSNSGITYNPPVVTVAAPPPLGTGNIQAAIDSAAAGSLIVLSPGTYNENLLLWKPVKLQGLGPGGVIGAHEMQGRDPEDPRFNIKGTIVDGRFFQQNGTAFDATVAAHAPYFLPNFTSGNPSVVLRGADITMVAQNASAYNLPNLTSNQGIFSQARIDGLGLMTGHGDGAGGIQLQAAINNLQITNNVLENNGGVFAGGIGLGQPYVHDSHNYNVRIDRNRIIGNGGLTTSGGLGVFYGSNNYELANSVVCSNFSVEYGAGVSHIGLSPNGNIHDNRIYYNESVDSGGGIAIESELPVGGATLGDGSGAVNIDRNLIQSNISTLDDGGGIFVLDALKEAINIRNNMIVDNVAADLGGAIMLDDASNVRIINNTIANNATTASSENSQIGVPHAAGLASEANDPLFQATLPAGSPDFSNPVALFNNIFWGNTAYTLDRFGPGATLISSGTIDLEVHGTTNNADTFTPRYSDLTNGQLLGPNGVLHAVPANQGNSSGDPLFVTPFVNELAVSGSRLDPQQAAVSITGQDPPVGLTGDYHLQVTSPAIDAGVGYSNIPVIPAPAPPVQTPPSTSILAPCSGNLLQLYPADFDQQFRPMLLSSRARTPWDQGADEFIGVPILIPKVTGTPQFNWNGTGQLQCSASTVPVTP